MNLLLGWLDRSLERFNRAPLWRGECQVWGERMRSATFDRWLYLRLHRLGWMGASERALLARHTRPGMVVVDVGSNIGLYTLHFARLAGPSGQIWAFEPDPALFSLLQANVGLGGQTNIKAFNLALGARASRRTLQTMVLNSGDNHLAVQGSRIFRRPVEVEVAPLDLVAPGLRPDLVKIDVQGWELEVLQGMEATLARSPRVRLLLEFWPEGFRRAGRDPDEIAHWLSERGFSIHRADTSERLGGDGLKRLTRRLTGLKHIDLLAERGEGRPS